MLNHFLKVDDVHVLKRLALSYEYEGKFEEAFALYAKAFCSMPHPGEYIRAKLKKLRSKVDFPNHKIFVIGKNKTGTTSLEKMFISLGYNLGNQTIGEGLAWAYERGDMEEILNFCDSADVFQDIPFSFPKMYEYLYKKYPDAKYILLERDSKDVWYNSLTRFHKQLLRSQGIDDELSLKNLSQYKYKDWKGFLVDMQRIHYGISNPLKLYDYEVCTNSYVDHINDAKEFFKGKSNFISINLSDEGAYKSLSDLLSISENLINIPHTNKSS